MIYTIKNSELEVKVESLGAELQSIKKGEKEYLWQGDENSWSSKATNLFPFIGRSTNGKYIYKNNEYEMTPHGFVRYIDFKVSEISERKIVLETSYTDKSLKIYPFKFNYQLSYEVINNKLQISHRVLNEDEKTMYFALGGHPGFNIPINENLEFNDYYIEFSEQFSAKKYDIIEFNLGELKDYPLKNNKILNLNHTLFDTDALIFKDAPKSLTIKSDKDPQKITINYPDMKFLAIWHTPKKQTPFICIEPWTAVPARHGIVEDIEKLEDFIKLEPNKIYNNKWEIEI